MWFTTRRMLEAILRQTQFLIYQGARIMATVKQLQDDLDAIQADVATVKDQLTVQAQTIKDLQDQLAAGEPVSQDQLDALSAEAAGIRATLES